MKYLKNSLANSKPLTPEEIKAIGEINIADSAKIVEAADIILSISKSKDDE